LPSQGLAEPRLAAGKAWPMRHDLARGWQPHLVDRWSPLVGDQPKLEEEEEEKEKKRKGEKNNKII